MGLDRKNRKFSDCVAVTFGLHDLLSVKMISVLTICLNNWIFLSHDKIVKISKRKLHLKGSQEAGSGSSCTLPLQVNCRPNRKKGTLQVPTVLATPLQSQQQEERLSLPSPLPHNSPANERLMQLSQ